MTHDTSCSSSNSCSQGPKKRLREEETPGALLTEEEEKRKRRRVANRNSARKSRYRQAVYMSELKKKEKTLRKENEILSHESKNLREQVHILRRLLQLETQRHEIIVQQKRFSKLTVPFDSPRTVASVPTGSLLTPSSAAVHLASASIYPQKLSSVAKLLGLDNERAFKIV